MNLQLEAIRQKRSQQLWQRLAGDRRPVCYRRDVEHFCIEPVLFAGQLKAEDFISVANEGL
jgi:hypothetical protein